MRKIFATVALLAFGLCAGCSANKVATDAAMTLAGAQGFLAQAQANHSAYCQSNPNVNFPCGLIRQGVAAQNAAVSALEVYCGWPAPPTPAEVKAAGNNVCKPNKNAEAALTLALGNLTGIVAQYKSLSGGKP